MRHKSKPVDKTIVFFLLVTIIELSDSTKKPPLLTFLQKFHLNVVIFCYVCIPLSFSFCLLSYVSFPLSAICYIII